MRDCVSLVAQIFDPTGRLTPIITGFKLDISQLHRSGLKWGDEIPDNLRRIWSSNYDMIKEINQLRYQRAIVPLDAKNLGQIEMTSHFLGKSDHFRKMCLH